MRRYFAVVRNPLTDFFRPRLYDSSAVDAHNLFLIGFKENRLAKYSVSVDKRKKEISFAKPCLLTPGIFRTNLSRKCQQFKAVRVNGT